MRRSTRIWLFWLPRILCLLFAVFLGLFALDVFGEGGSFWHTVKAFLIHLIPVYLVLLVLAASWRWEWIGALAFPALGVYYFAMTHGRMHWSAYLLISGPLFLLGALFLLNWRFHAELRERR